jgi:hypothetical protein
VRSYLEKFHHTHTKERAGGVAQGVGPEFKPQYCQKKKKKNTSVETIPGIGGGGIKDSGGGGEFKCI